MKRRGFLGGLFALPAVVAAAPTAAPVKPAAKGEPLLVDSIWPQEGRYLSFSSSDPPRNITDPPFYDHEAECVDHEDDQ